LASEKIEGMRTFFKLDGRISIHPQLDVEVLRPPGADEQ
jgi:hypothetical protein